MAERSKAVAQGAIPKGRGLEPHRCHFCGRELLGRYKYMHGYRGASIDLYALSINVWHEADVRNAKHLKCNTIFNPCCRFRDDTLAERLRRRPAKPMGSPRVGSNPTGVVLHAIEQEMSEACSRCANDRYHQPLPPPSTTSCHHTTDQQPT